MKSSLPAFKTLDLGMIRVPLLAFEEIENTIFSPAKDGSSVALESLLSRHPIILDSIRYASVELSDALGESAGDCTVDTLGSRALRSFQRYVVRMAGRTTPFGLFSSVSVTRFGGSGKILLSDAQRAVSVYSDAEWYSILLGSIEHDPLHWDDFAIRTTPSLTLADRRLFLHLDKVQGKYGWGSLRTSVLLEAVVRECKHGISVGDLRTRIITTFPSLDKERFDSYIRIA